MNKLFFEHLSELRPINADDIALAHCTRHATAALPHSANRTPIATCLVKRTGAPAYLCAGCTTAIRVERFTAALGHAVGSVNQLGALVRVFAAKRGYAQPTRLNAVETCMRRALREWEEKRLILRVRQLDANGKLQALLYIWRDACPTCFLRRGHAIDCPLPQRVRRV